jgi:xyloglucan fucosyltransferase
MDMEMSSGSVAGSTTLKLQEDHPAVAAVPWTPARRRRVLIVAGVMALLLLAFFVLGQESASTVWEIASAKLTAIKNNGKGGTYGNHFRDIVHA